MAKEAQPNASGDQAQFQVTAPQLTLPKGGGAIRGIGEKFAANPVTGSGSMTVPIATSPGRAGFGPQLALSYDSGTGNGPFGFGWSLSLPSITRKTEKGLPRYADAEESGATGSETFPADAEVTSRAPNPAGRPTWEDRYESPMVGRFSGAYRWFVVRNRRRMGI